MNFYSGLPTGFTPHRGLWFLVLLPLVSCGPSRADRLRTWAPQLTPEAARALTGSDAAFHSYCGKAGAPALLGALYALSINRENDPDYVYRYQEHTPQITRICDCLADEYGLDGPRRRLDMFLQFTPEQFTRYLRWARSYPLLAHDRTIPPETRLARLQACLDSALASPELAEDAARIHAAMAGVRDEMGDVEGELRDDLASYRLSVRAGVQRSTINQAGTVGYVYGKLGRTDSMLVYYARSAKLARQCRLPGEFARAEKLLAVHFEMEGKFSAAANCLDEALAFCREEHAGVEETQYLVPAMELHAKLGSWEQVRDEMERCRVLLRENRNSFSETMINGIALDAYQMEGRRLFAMGQTEPAGRIFRSIRDEVRRQPNREAYAYFLMLWARGLLDNGRPEEALPLIEEGAAYADSARLPNDRMDFAVLQADALCRTGRFDEANTTLARFRALAGSESELPFRRQWVEHDAIAMRCALARGDQSAVDLSGRTARNRLERILARLEPGAEAYLFLDSCRDLLEAFHEAVAGDPVAGYGVEIWWRSLPETLGSNSAATGSPRGAVNAGAGRGVPDPHLAAAFSRLGERGAARIRRLEAVHLLYRKTARAVLRWTVGPGGFRLDSLAVDPDALGDAISKVLGPLSAPSRRSPPDPDLTRHLADLAGLLLPPGLVPAGGDSTSLLLVSPDAELRSLPFATLNTGSPPDYLPLGALRDVAVLKFPRSPAAGFLPSRPGLIVADPDIAPAVRRRYPLLGPLPATRREALSVLAGSPAGTRLLDGDHATRGAFLSGAPEASFLYISAHFIRDPQSPYLVFLPLAADSSSESIANSSLDLSDVLTMHLRGCALTVLSGCGTGAPYTTVAGTGPSFADAFLAAGSRVVVHTFWEVEDDDAAAFMARFARGLAGGSPPERALNQARREAIADGLSPGIWGTFGVKIGNP